MIQEEKKESIKITYSLLKIITGSNLSRRRLPYMVADSLKPGPIIWLTACGHGDEVGGIVIIQEIFKKVKKKGLLKGCIHAFPLMNPIGFETTSRNITLSKEDLNRSFPGNKKGSLGERIANKIFSTILQTSPALVLDLHNDWIKSIPYSIIDPNPGTQYKEVNEKTKIYNKAAGLVTILDTGDIQSSLTYNLLKNKIPALTLELGESYIVNEENITFGVNAIWNLLSHLKMIDTEDELFLYPLPDDRYRNKTLQYVDDPLSSSSGIIRFLVRPGDLIIKGQPVARIYDAFGKLQETISSLHDCIILGHSDSSVAFPGMTIVGSGIV
ncbi:MAG: succinylglutamate desuccinylase/aspartoacylase family protein [Spirochaetes bacterium]|nr:succinylglutamate desuccinylase/aspartoacylase family protein [Spirochaetota bacterium]